MSALTFPPLRHEWSDHQRPVYLSFYPVCVCVSALLCPPCVCTCAQSALPVRNWHHFIIWLVSHDVIDEAQTSRWTTQKRKGSGYFSTKVQQQHETICCIQVKHSSPLFPRLFSSANNFHQNTFIQCFGLKSG